LPESDKSTAPHARPAAKLKPAGLPGPQPTVLLVRAFVGQTKNFRSPYLLQMVSENQMQQAAASHATDFEIPLYNV
jgi:hypothetical protein